jgi:hypothetical protein
MTALRAQFALAKHRPYIQVGVHSLHLCEGGLFLLIVTAARIHWESLTVICL